MVQSVGSLADSFTLFQSGGVARAASGSGQSTGGIASFGANQSGNSSDASTTSIASILDNSNQAQTTSSGDFANVFQRLSSGLQSLMVQLQSMAAGTSASSSTSSTTDVSAASTATTDATATDTAATDVAATVASDTAAKVDVMHHASGGNRALQGDIDAMINDLHGFIQVASGDALATADTTTASPTKGGAGATGGPASSDGNVSASQSAASSAADTAALNETTYGYAQNLMQALQNYSVASANVSNPQSSAISAVG